MSDLAKMKIFKEQLDKLDPAQMMRLIESMRQNIAREARAKVNRDQKLSEGRFEATKKFTEETDVKRSVGHLVTMSHFFRHGGCPFHFLLCLDQSGSMTRGQKWQGLIKACTSFYKTRSTKAGKYSEDVYSALKFSDKHEVLFERQTLEEAMQVKLVHHGGGTSFGPALDRASTIFQNGGDRFQPVLLFMSDGENDDGSMAKKMEKMAESFEGLVCHTVFFREDGQAGQAASQKLSEMANVVGKKSSGNTSAYHLARDDLELAEVFQHVASSPQPSKMPMASAIDWKGIDAFVDSGRASAITPCCSPCSPASGCCVS